MQKNKNKQLKIHYLEDTHNDIIVQARIADKIGELYSSKQIQAIFCEDILYTGKPLSKKDLKFYKNLIPYLSYLKTEELPVYGGENPRLYQEHCDAINEIDELYEVLNEISIGIESNKITSSRLSILKETLCLDMLLERYINTINRHKDLRLTRSNELIDKTKEVADEEGYESVALICGASHQYELAKRAKELGCLFQTSHFQPTMCHGNWEASRIKAYILLKSELSKLDKNDSAENVIMKN